MEHVEGTMRSEDAPARASWLTDIARKMPIENRNKGRDDPETPEYGDDIEPVVVIIHYSAGPGDEVALGRYMAQQGNSAHFGVGRTGGIAQYVSLKDTAWHAGTRKGAPPSRFPRKGLGTLEDTPSVPRLVNRMSVGIEECNLGWASKRLPPERVGTGVHRNPACRARRWELFPRPQIDATVRLLERLVDVLPSLQFICGHEDVAHQDITGAGAKVDPGPLFPFDEIEDRLGGRLLRVLYDFNERAWVRP